LSPAVERQASILEGNGVGDDVADGRVGHEAGELGELIVVEVAGDLERHSDLLVAGADGLVEAEEAVQVHVALDGAFQAVEHDPARGGVVDDRARQARGERVEQVLGRVGGPVIAEQHRGLVGVEDERLDAAGVRSPGAIEPLDLGAIVATVEPLVAGAELEPRQRRVGADVVDRPEETVDFDSVDLVGDLHGQLLVVEEAETIPAVCRHGKERPLPGFFPPSQPGPGAPALGVTRGMIGPMRRLDVRLLGRFEVAVDAHRIAASAWEHRRAEDLVKLLALAPGHRLTRDEVVEALWPHLGAKAGVGNLHKAAYYARRALGWPEAIVVRHGVVALAPDHRVETDVERLEAGGSWDGDLVELLPDDRYEQWTAEHRERLAGVRAAALRRQGRWEELLAIDPADEEITRALMRQRAAVGDRAAAARQFRRLREALAVLGLTPSEESLSLYREISRGDPVHAPTRPREAMVGRNRELAVGRRALDATGRGGRGALLILGDAGMGKTRLVDALLEEAQARGWHTWRGAVRRAGAPNATAPAIEKATVDSTTTSTRVGDARAGGGSPARRPPAVAISVPVGPATGPRAIPRGKASRLPCFVGSRRPETVA
jgi:DNA-binding SARP family transcriptional activator